MANAYFLHQIKHNKTNDTWDKGIVVKASQPTGKENLEEALQSYHAYLGAYAYGHDASVDYVACYITDKRGNRAIWETWEAPIEESEE